MEVTYVHEEAVAADSRSPVLRLARAKVQGLSIVLGRLRYLGPHEWELRSPPWPLSTPSVNEKTCREVGRGGDRTGAGVHRTKGC